MTRRRHPISAASLSVCVSHTLIASCLLIAMLAVAAIAAPSGSLLQARLAIRGIFTTPLAQQSKLGEYAKQVLKEEQAREQNRRPGRSNNNGTSTSRKASFRRALRSGKQPPPRQLVKQPTELDVTFMADAPGIDIFLDGQRLGRTTKGGKLTAKVRRGLVQPDQTTLTFKLVAVPDAPAGVKGVPVNTMRPVPRQATPPAIVNTLQPPRSVQPLIAHRIPASKPAVTKEVSTANRQPIKVGQLLDKATRKLPYA